MRRLLSHAAVVVTLAALTVVPGYSADHRDSAATTADPATDINDVYAWMVDNDTVAVAMTVFPFAGDTAVFSPDAQYVFHLASGPAYGATTTEVTVICEWAPNQRVQCWGGDTEYLVGVATDPAGVSSASGAMKVFAGLRDDPFFFNLNGFQEVVSMATPAVEGGAFSPDANGCMTAIPMPTRMALVDQLAQEPGGMTPVLDDFAGANTLAIVVELDKALAAPGGDILAVWASTNQRN